MNALTNEGFADSRKCKGEAGGCKSLCIKRDVVVIPVRKVNTCSLTPLQARMDYSSSWSMYDRRGVLVMPASVHLQVKN